MNILDAVMNANNGDAVRQLGAQVGLGTDQTSAALSALVPALAAGFQRNMQSQGGLDSLLSALTSGSHGQYIDNPASLGHAAATADGNSILGHVLGSKAASIDVATRAAAQTGISAEVLKKMLPLAATLMMGAFAKHASSGSSTSFAPGLSGAGGGLMSMLTPLLDQNKDGSIVDDVTSMLGRFMNR